MKYSISSWLMINFFFITIFIVLNFAVFADETSMTISVEQFQSQSKDSWQLLKREYLNGVNMGIELQYDSYPVSKIDVIIKGKNELNSFNDPEVIVARNPEYAFKIEKTKPNDKWRIQNLYNDTNQCENSQFIHKHLESSPLAFKGLFLEDGWLEDIISADSFVVKSIKHKVIDSAEYIIVAFESEYNLDRNNQVLGGTLVFDPSRYWVLIESNVKIKFTFLEKQKTITKMYDAQTHIDYFDIDKIPFPKKVKTTYIHTDRVPIVCNINYINVSRTKEPDRIFYLSHYGFSEPSSPTRRGNVIRIVFIVCGFLLIGCGLYFRYIAAKS